MGCRRTAPASELVRLVVGPDGRVVVGRGRPGRGAWICREPSCVDQAIHRGALRRALRVAVASEDPERLRSAILGASLGR